MQLGQFYDQYKCYESWCRPNAAQNLHIWTHFRPKHFSFLIDIRGTSNATLWQRELPHSLISPRYIQMCRGWLPHTSPLPWSSPRTALFFLEKYLCSNYLEYDFQIHFKENPRTKAFLVMRYSSWKIWWKVGFIIMQGKKGLNLGFLRCRLSCDGVHNFRLVGYVPLEFPCCCSNSALTFSTLTLSLSFFCTVTARDTINCPFTE